MKIIIDTDTLIKENISLKEFAMLLYYSEIDTNRECVNYKYTENNLWNKGYLIKELIGYSLNGFKWNKLVELAISEQVPDEEHLRQLAIKLMSIVPQGLIGDGPYYYKGNTKEIIQSLRKFHSIYKDKNNTCYSDDLIIEATKIYNDSFDDDYTHMVALKNFIYRTDRVSGLESSLLASYLEDMADGKKNT